MVDRSVSGLLARHGRPARWSNLRFGSVSVRANGCAPPDSASGSAHFPDGKRSGQGWGGYPQTPPPKRAAPSLDPPPDGIPLRSAAMASIRVSKGLVPLAGPGGEPPEKPSVRGRTGRWDKNPASSSVRVLEQRARKIPKRPRDEESGQGLSLKVEATRVGTKTTPGPSERPRDDRIEGRQMVDTFRADY